ncbi:hypothetical protein LDENG_00164440 [Lucifuga dentata]|nr:hypothetical protein LDENG_00164440 [Lucifuga dentata]
MEYLKALFSGLCFLVIALLGQITHSYGINFHCYADDTQLHMPPRVENPYHLRTAKKLGVIFATNLSFHAHVTEVTKTVLFHLRNIAIISSCLSKADAKTLIHAFMSSRLDYCNALFSGLPKCSLKKLQTVQNTAALTKTRKFDSITPALLSLH